MVNLNLILLHLLYSTVSIRIFYLKKSKFLLFIHWKDHLKGFVFVYTTQTTESNRIVKKNKKNTDNPLSLSRKSIFMICLFICYCCHNLLKAIKSKGLAIYIYIYIGCIIIMQIRNKQKLTKERKFIWH